MHGIVFSELRKFVDHSLGPGAWQRLLKEAGLGNRIYMAIQEYPDQEAVALVQAAARITHKSPAVILEEFGQFIAPQLLQMYKALVQPNWKTLDLIENTEEVIHKVVRMKNPGARPAELKCQRISPGELLLVYASPRKMCALAKGIARGVANHFGERISVSETQCMLNGAPECHIRLRVM
ncbi:MAG: heme ABC transporter permease CcmB [Calditrichaeota bacterium]|nr:heme ABC transporter permease CcmB [Calditrichota bacterium]